MGRRVLLVDFDLEAPGLDTFDLLHGDRPRPLANAGMVEYVTEYMRTKCVPDISYYVYRAYGIGKKGGPFLVMPAGSRRDPNYQSALAKIDWMGLYRDDDGFLLFENMKAQWEQEFDPDYVLIDSRTGHTDVEGICTRQLPDAVAVFFFPNEQNLVGLKDVCRRIRGERTSGLKKDIRLHFVMSNVPDLDDEDRVLRDRRLAFQRELGYDKLDAVIHRYESVLLFNQAIFVVDKPKSRLAREYKRLVKSLIMYNWADRDGARLFLKNYYIPILGSSEELERAQELVHDALDQISRNFPDDAELMQQIKEYRQIHNIRAEV
jgi:hypothetical protein